MEGIRIMQIPFLYVNLASVVAVALLLVSSSSMYTKMHIVSMQSYYLGLLISHTSCPHRLKPLVSVSYMLTLNKNPR